MMKSYLVACIVVLCACLVLGKPAPSGTKVNSQDISKSINRLIEDLRTHKAAEDHDQKELVKIVLAFAGKLQELQEGIQHIDEVEGQAAKATAKREDVLKGPGVKASSTNEGDVPHIVQQVVVKAPEAPDNISKLDDTQFVKLLLTALEKLHTKKGKKEKPSKPVKPSKSRGEIKKEVDNLKGSEGGDFLERLDKRGQYYDAELDDGFDMFKKRNQKQEKKAAARGEQTKEYASELEKAAKAD
ncbi:uncharacterized protein LOC135495399 isoform X3 [Lineus longissimus]|uniref:uncharacterized protein LOC135495399 isoform X3 n=1 Tax=Lineus longissimus TaxID=88925 RepID=UPI00315CFEB8